MRGHFRLRGYAVLVFFIDQFFGFGVHSGLRDKERKFLKKLWWCCVVGAEGVYYYNLAEDVNRPP